MTKFLGQGVHVVDPFQARVWGYQRAVQSLAVIDPALPPFAEEIEEVVDALGRAGSDTDG